MAEQTEPPDCDGSALNAEVLTTFEKPAVAFIPSVYNGPMHLGHLRTYMANWLYAKKVGWRLVVIMENCYRWACGRPEIHWMEKIHKLGLWPDEYILDRTWEPAIGRHHDGDYPLCQVDWRESSEPQLAYSEMTGRGEVLCPFQIPRGLLGKLYACTCDLNTIKDDLGDWFFRYDDPCGDRMDPWPEYGLARLRGGDCCYDNIVLDPVVGWIRKRKVHWTNQAYMRYVLHQHGVRLMVRGRDLKRHTAYQDFVADRFGWPKIETKFIGLVRDKDGNKLSKSVGAPLLNIANSWDLLECVLSSLGPLPDTDGPYGWSPRDYVAKWKWNAWHEQDVTEARCLPL